MAKQSGTTTAPPSQWTLRLAAPPDVALASLHTVSTHEIGVVSTKGSTVVLAFGGREPAVHVAAEVRPHEAGSEVTVRRLGARTSPDGFGATALALFCVVAGWDIAHVSPRGYILAFYGEIALLLLIGLWIEAARQRRADFMALVHAIDQKLAPLKPGEQGATYRVLAGPEPAPAEPEPEYGAGSRRRRRR